MDMAGIFGDKISGFFGPLNAGDGVQIVHEILETDILQLFHGIQAVTIKMIKGHFGFIDVHQDKGWAFHLLRMFKPQTFREPFDEGGLPASELPFETKNGAGLKLPGKRLRKLDRLLG